MRDFRELKVWEKGHGLTLAVYQATGRFPRDELYGLTSQIRRSCASIPANIAEGCGRDGDAELEYHLLLAHDLNLLDSSAYERLAREVTEVKRMLTSFIRKLKAES